MEQTASYKANSQCWSNMDAGSKLMDGFTNITMCKPSSDCSPSKVQIEEPFDMHHSYEPSITTTSCNYSTNPANSSIFCTPWSTYPDEMKLAASTQLNTKIQAEKNEYGSEADLYGLVSNILDEPDKTQPYSGNGICSPILKSVWPLNMNKLSDHQDLLPDIKESEDLAIMQQNFYGSESLPSTETHKKQDLYHGLTDLEQDEHWLYSCQTDNLGSYNINPKMSIQDYSLPKNRITMSTALPETSKDCFQKRDSLVSPLNKYNFETDIGRFDMINHSKTKHGKCSIQDLKNCTNVSSEFPNFDAETYAKLFQVKLNCQKRDDFMPDQNYTAAKATLLMTDRPFPKDSTFVSEYDHKTDYGVKTLSGGSSAFVNHLKKLNQMRHDLQNSDYFKPSSLMSSIPTGNSNRSSWVNGQAESNSHNTYCNQVKLNGVLSNSQRNPNLVSNYSSVYSPLISTSSFQKYSNENPSFSPYENSTADRTQEGFGKTREERIFESISEKRLKPLNGVCENASSGYSLLDNTGKRIFPEKKQSMQYNLDEKTFEGVAQSYKELLGSALNYNNQRQGSSDNKPLDGSKLTHPQSTYFPNGLMMGDLRNNFTTHASNNFTSQFPHNLGHTIHPIMDNYDPYSYGDLGQVCPQLNDLLHGDASFHGLAPMFNSQRSMKPRSIPASELHLHLEECYEQCRALEKERKRAESLLVKYYPGKKVSSTNNTPIPRLTANPSRVDRLIVDQLREQARVATLLGKMERFRSSPLHANISTALDRYMEAIHNVQARRKDEIANTSKCQKLGKPRHHADRDVFILASSVKDMVTATRKARTALWCALQMTLPKMSPTQSTGDLQRVLQTLEKSHDKI
ncbi:meiosis-specific coiled-coil domain-containing protein MEIOC isoform X2 [Mixophyes fleayi]|uniref:meiosis-specific coiled-coil domain-containing protein MEIOC isoform X2 n=1 Tax=Mixophyes fleayi TaxID=3061075 RepID=UPI003F4DBFF2